MGIFRIKRKNENKVGLKKNQTYDYDGEGDEYRERDEKNQGSLNFI